MHLPAKAEGSVEFIQRARDLIEAPTTSLYVDTSFLMWLTKIGPVSRDEFFQWISATCPKRVHVPTWAAHEYFQHHIADTIPLELHDRVRQLEAVGANTYEFLRPFMDRPLDPGGQAIDAFRTDVRSTLTTLMTIARTMDAWRDNYDEHAAAVIAFINECPPCETNVFEYMGSIGVIAGSRFTGRIPPGFQDRNKGKRHTPPSEPTGGHTETGDNKWGDLVFWKEILDHARGAKYRAAVILSNDRKNDWYFRASSPPEARPGTRNFLRPLPAPHPMLEHEARSAGIADVLLLDSPYLAEVMSRGGPSRSSFADRDHTRAAEAKIKGRAAQRRDPRAGPRRQSS